MTDAKQLYDQDFLLWSKEQADALRAAAHGGSNRELDWKHLAEEIEDLGISQRSALRSQIRRILRHLAKLEHSPASTPRQGWIETVGDARAEIEDLLETSPSLKAELSGDIAKQTPRAIKLAIQDLQGYEEIDTARLHHLRAASYTEEQVLGDWFPAEPPSSYTRG
jgi:Domain of unknown function DUF29